MIFSSCVSPAFNSATLLDFLTRRFTYRNSSEWNDAIAASFLTVNKETAAAERILATGDIVSFIAPDIAEDPADLTYAVIFEDEWLMAIDKPANLLVHGRGKTIRNTLIYQVRYNRNPPQYQDATIINRIDRETSGIILVAKNKIACRKMHEIIIDHALVKIYTAIVHGIPAWETITVDQPVGHDPDSSIPYKFGVTDTGKPSITMLRRLRNAGSHASVLECRPISGRTHQIRVHCLWLGHPVVGDKLYGMPEKEYLQWRDAPGDARPTLAWKRQALHCSSVSFTHPFTGATLTLCAPLPQNMIEMEKKLNENNAPADGLI